MSALASRVRPVWLLVLLGVLLAACTNSPPPPLVNSPVASTQPSQPADPTQVVVGVDSVAGGYNPHLLANQTTVARTLGELVLPSVFRSAPDGTPQLDQTLMNSAEVTSAEPYTVTYTIRKDAAWGDGPPIAAEDFAYLRDNMRSQPGVADASGYKLITSVSGRDGGRTVEVVFSKPYPGWRTLFHDLLPSHVLKDAPGGWAAALTETFPAAGGPFSIKRLDPERGEIILQRNDRYWGPSTKLQQIILRKADPSGLVKALTGGDDQLGLFPATKSTSDALAGGNHTLAVSTVPNPVLVQLLLRPSTPLMANPKIRAAVAAAFDRDSLISLGTGGGPAGQLRADSLVLAPSRPGFVPTIPGGGSPAKPDPAKVEQSLTEAGYAKTGGAWLRDGQPLNLVIGVPGDREPYSGLARLVQQQLTAAGIGSRVLNTNGDQLFSKVITATPTPTSTTNAAATGDSDSLVDIVIAPQPVSGDPATDLASAFGCRTGLPDGTSSPANAAGFCDRELQPAIEAALTGAMPLSDALATIEPALWKQNIAIPLFQLADVLAVRPELSGVSVGPPLVGPFAGAPEWQRSVRR
ncbi:ABC transporter family substrate-binding protein [Kutzneria albida]|uniref:Extracellular solute-binding protein n=1 Tax=Kutzneria albida DSM 43870 TaxID=1449976 RepID=W5W189_9PSEU|nr:extracellular solute-binding protein [Kutzneria albida DSM 43870]